MIEKAQSRDGSVIEKVKATMKTQNCTPIFYYSKTPYSAALAAFE